MVAKGQNLNTHSRCSVSFGAVAANPISTTLSVSAGGAKAMQPELNIETYNTG